MKKKISVLISVLAFFVLCMLAFSANAQDTEKVLTQDNSTASTYFQAYQFSGIGITPALTVECDGVTLKKDVDFKAEYFNNINVGTAYAVITGIGSYSGSFIKEYPIIPVAGTNEIETAVEKTHIPYDGKAKTPGITAVYRRDTLVKDKDFTLEYTNNVNIGLAKITMRGLGNYSFTKTITFKIVPVEVKGFVFTSPETNSVTLKWNKMSDINGYQIMEWDYDKKAYKTVEFVSPNTTSFTVKGLSPSCLYKYNIRAYKCVGNEAFYGVYTNDTMTRTRSAATNMTAAYMTSDGIVAKWNTVRGAGYVLRYATRGDFANVKEIFITGGYTNSYTIRNVDRDSDYYVQITPYTTLNDVKFYSKRSTPLYTRFGKRLSYFETKLPYNPDRTVNVKLACNAINGVVIHPGQTFSFNYFVGKRTYEKGYRNAPVIANGRVVDGIGGGICQVATTLFNGALYADMKIVERHQHVLRNTYVPYGRDAAISWGSQDLMWRNDTNYAVKVYMRVEGSTVICEFYTSGLNPIPSISLPVTQRSDGTYVLKRYSSGYCNYTAYTKF